MIFSHISERDGAELLSCIARTLKSRKIELQRLIISTYDQRFDCMFDTDKLQLWLFDRSPDSDLYPGRYVRSPTAVRFSNMKDDYSEAWYSIFPDIPAIFEPTIGGAIITARQCGGSSGAQTFITGSLHLVGGALWVLEPEA